MILICTFFAIGALATSAGAIGAYYYVQPSLQSAEAIRDIPLEVPLRIFSRDGYLISEIGERRRIPVSYEDIPEHVIQAFIAAEDRRFFQHSGIDYRGVLRAIIRMAKTGNASGGGGSTLTQQLARDYFLTREQTLSRKLKEAFLALKIEQEFTKKQILALFLNKMFFGQRAHGVAAASKVFFNKDLADINVAEAATLAGILPAPSRYNPVSSAKNAKVRRRYVLKRMLTLEYINEKVYQEAIKFPLESQLHGAAIELNAPFVAEMVRREMLKRYGEDTYTAGYQVVTSLDSRMQKASNYALRNGLLEFTRRRGYRGPLSKIDLSEELLSLPPKTWPLETLEPLNQYAPGGLSLAVVAEIFENNNVKIIFQDGGDEILPWSGLSWASSFIDRENRGPSPKSVKEILAIGDVIYVMPTTNGTWALAQIPDAQAALVSMDPYDGAIAALTGGFDYTTSKFNRARQAYRQPGSAFKPFIYSAALEHGNTTATVVLDAPVVISSAELEAIWRPINYSGRFYGPTRMREALVRSMNLVSVRLLLFETGIRNAVKHIKNFGFNDATLIKNGSLALGGGDASVLDMAQGYAIIANGGYGIKPYIINSIFSSKGETLYQAKPAVVCHECLEKGSEKPIIVEEFAAERALNREMMLEEIANVVDSYRPTAIDAPELFEHINAAPQSITPQNAYLVQDMMRDVVRRGTGIRARRELGRSDLSGKTGTSNDRRDAWFGGFNADIAAVVWVGYDDSQPLGPKEEGSRTALPIWIEFARIALENIPEHQMPMPEGIVSVRINKETGCPARASQSNVIFEVFRENNVPQCEQFDEIADPFNNAAEADSTSKKDNGSESLF
tara:strand:- start:4116 stop:6653 length:2538 start_codon:yes stop_codon:yes gene_type:complete